MPFINLKKAVQSRLRHMNAHKIDKNFLIGLVITLAAAITIYSYYLYQKYFPSTDNAYVSANLIDVEAKVGGYIDHIEVTDNQRVNKGDLLLTIDPIDLSLQLKQAQQSLYSAQKEADFAKQHINSATANKEKAQSDYDFSLQMANRHANLYHLKAGSLQNMQKYANQAAQAKQALQAAITSLAQAATQYSISQTKINAAKITIHNAKVNQSYTRLYAPVDGYVTHLNLQSGQLIMAGQKLFGLVDDAHWWVNVNLKETQLARIKPGQKATVQLDMYRHTYIGKTQSISYASGNTFSLLPAENASGNWVKVAQYFTVRVQLKNNPQYPLRVGASAEVKINTLGGK